MKLTKYQHACFAVEKNDDVIVVDPGGFTTDFQVDERTVAVVVTHQHPDHFDQSKLDQIIRLCPDAVILAHETLTSQIQNTENVRVVKVGDVVSIAGFQLEFFGGVHAEIHPSFDDISNLGILIDDTVYYPGDSFALPSRPIDTLLLPVAAPWMRAAEMMDYVTKIRPRIAIPTHDAILSDFGKALADRQGQMFAEQVGTEYQRIDGKTIVLK